jgi:hypothetical protein
MTINKLPHLEERFTETLDRLVKIPDMNVVRK